MSKEKKDGNWFKRHKVLTVILAIVVIGIVAMSSGGGDQSSKSDAGKNDSKTVTTAKMGEPARDGKFEFVTKNLECGQPSVGSNFTTKTAQGQYCLLTVSIKNIGNEKQSLYSGDQKLLDASKKEYSADDTATMYAATSASTWLNDINPGNSIEGVIVFDVPKDVTPTTAELHDSSFSGGVKITLQ